VEKGPACLPKISKRNTEVNLKEFLGNKWGKGLEKETHVEENRWPYLREKKQGRDKKANQNRHSLNNRDLQEIEVCNFTRGRTIGEKDDWEGRASKNPILKITSNTGYRTN